MAHSSIDKTKLAGTKTIATSPHVMAFQFLSEKIDDFVGRQTDPLRQRIMLIADETDEHGAYQVDLISQMQRGSAGIGRGRVLTQVIDTVHFVDPKTNRGVQIADLVAYAINRVARKRAAEQVSAGDTALIGMVDTYVLPRIRTYRETWPGQR